MTMSIKNYELVDIDIAALKPAAYNPRKISKTAKDALAASMARFGLVQPIVWNKRTGNVVGGHQRVEIIRESGEKTAKVVVVDLDEKEEKALNITLNSPTVTGQFTDDLQMILSELREGLPHEFMDFRLDDLLENIQPIEGQADANEAPDVPKQPVTKNGDLYKLGSHRLLCGDSSKRESFGTLLGANRANLVFTDPPYGIDYGKKKRFLNSFQKAGRNLKDIANDAISKDDLLKMLVSTFSLAREHSLDSCSYYVTAPQGGELGLMMMMMMMMMMSGLPTRHVLIWNKDSQNFSLGRLDYEYKHEPILYAWKKTHRFFGKGQCTNSVWDIPKPKSSKEHPTMKPIELVENAILNSSKPGELILDMFLGSGTTIIASERTGRKCCGMEIDPAYCDVIVERWQKYTGKKAELKRP